MLKTTKDMYKEKHIGSDFVTFEQQQLNGWLSTLLTAFLLTLFNQSDDSDRVS